MTGVQTCALPIPGAAEGPPAERQGGDDGLRLLGQTKLRTSLRVGVNEDVPANSFPIGQI